jgi:hypothetical protein
VGELDGAVDAFLECRSAPGGGGVPLTSLECQVSELGNSDACPRPTLGPCRAAAAFNLVCCFALLGERAQVRGTPEVGPNSSLF